MKLYIFDDKNAGSKYLSERVLDLVKKNNDINIGFAGGKTFIKFYEYLCDDYKKNNTNWFNVKTFNLDEFENAKGSEPYSCLKYMKDNLFNIVNIQSKNVWFPTVINVSKETLHNDDVFLEKAKISFQILGVGRNGHIGFNEPGALENSTTTEVKLAKTTIEDKANLFCNGDESMIPRNAVTVGIKTIGNSQKIVIVAFGKSKNNSMNQLLSNDKITSEFPLTYMKNHKDVEVIIDNDCYGSINTLKDIIVYDKRS